MIDAEKILLINCSAPNYNLAIEKMKVYFGNKATEGKTVNDLFSTGYDAVMLSAIFSWDVPRAIAEAKMALRLGMKVMIGGGGTFKLRNWIKAETGIEPHYRPHPILENVDSRFKMVYFTRGCDEGCSFCTVPKIEGLVFTLNKISRPAQVLMDNNLSAIPKQFKEHIVEKYLSEGIRVVDANSGFEPKSVDEYTVKLFVQLPLRWWRIGFDEIGEEKQFIEAVKVVKAFSKKTIRAYTMIGKETIEECRYRCEKVISLGCEPVPQAYIELGAKTKSPAIMHDWDAVKLRDFQRFFYCPQLWRKLKLEDYAPRINQKPVFTK